MKNSFSLATLSFCIAIATLGCNRVQTPHTPAAKSTAGIAIIDLDEIARQLGSDKKIVTAIKQREAALNGKLSELAQSYNAELKKQKEAIEAESEKSTVQLASYQKQLNQNLHNAKAQAQQNLSVHRSQLVQQFRDAVRPAARSVADKRGLSIIVTKQDSLLYDFNPEHDITAEVVEVLRASMSSKAANNPPAEKQG
jgi:Skp family chaperone for outer membrane proteins